jgi:hypothetical protein
MAFLAAQSRDGYERQTWTAKHKRRHHDILSWASEAKRNQYSFCPQRLERSSQVKYLEKWLHLAPCCPETVKLVLPGPAMEAIQVTRFNFTNQLHALLSDPALVGNLDNLDVNPADPFCQVRPSFWMSFNCQFGCHLQPCVQKSMQETR